ncbi:type II secretion system F family protein [Geodermatophilus sp. Leaf369]|uniref:type II secretion system F family protein n=1 Tax=Geodermatophilus sp. Leaf369 TaxID=1736354 RepID=UPI0009E878CD|nr:type II secretion system F family protein [Geodermatophilus sp. Leaf369]
MSAVVLGLLGAAVVTWPRGSDPLVRRARRLQPRGRPGPPTVLPVAVLVVGAAVTTAALFSTPVVAALVGGAAVAGVRAWRRRAAERDTEARDRALAEALGVLAAELRAGRPLADATTTAVGGCPHPAVAAALGPVLCTGTAEPGEGGALARLAAAVTVSARTGCSLAAVVAAAEDDVRARLRTQAELRAAVSGPRASGVVLAGLPVLGLLMGAGVGADPWQVLTGTPVGTALLVGGVGLEALGLSWTARLVRRAAAR